MKRLSLGVISLITAIGLFSAVAPAAFANGSGGVSAGPAFYIHGDLYRTVGTPTDLSGTGAPAHSFDTIYDFTNDGLLSVADAAPGDRDFNGGRWMVHAVTVTNLAGALADPMVDMNGNDVLDSEEEVLAAIEGGYASDLGIVKEFVCTVNRLPNRPA